MAKTATPVWAARPFFALFLGGENGYNGGMPKLPEKIRRLYTGDNLAVMRGLEEESVDLIYLDPPFNSKRIYEGNLDSKMGKQAFKDIWRMSDITAEDNWRLRTLCPAAYELIDMLKDIHGESWQAYLTFMALRLDEMHKLLKPTGSIYLHCDYRMSAPLKLLMDIVFGGKNFINEVIWCYKSGGAPKKGYARKHDTILFYAKSENFLFNYEKEKSYGQSGGAHGGMVQYYKDENGVYSWAGCKDWWPISILAPTAEE
ncbi:MAG: site-specific DNA-methyltransferase, partial [Betaproteobacteria bacterium]|nr:site-specific DNA-methyltransferase [Betaproteobacteria bacterium]